MCNKNMVSLKEICEETRIALQEGKECLLPAYFSSMRAMLKGAISFLDFFIKIHTEQKVYCGNNPADFCFDLMTGEMVFLNEEAVCPMQEQYFGVPLAEDTRLTMSEFLAPEILQSMGPEKNGESFFNLETDRYFTAVFLFEYFFHTGSPFEGKMMVNRCFLSPFEKEMYRVDKGVFCMDAWNEENKPIKGIQDKLIRYWKTYPEGFGKMFQKAFLSGSIQAELRPTEVEWKRIIIDLMMDYKECSCGFHGFSHLLLRNENGARQCPKCKKYYYPIGNGVDQILLAQGEQLYECQTGRKPFDYHSVTGVIVENKKQKGLYGIKNVGDGVWQGLFPDGSRREILKGQVLPIWNNMSIRFEVGEEWTLRLISQIEEIKEERTEEEYES